MIGSRVRAALVAAAMLAAGSGAAAQEFDDAHCVSLDGLAAAAVGDTVAPDWSLRAVSGQDAPRAMVVNLDGRPAFRLEADSAAGQAWTELDPPIRPGPGRLEWAWRVDEVPSGSVLEDVDLDDAPARLFVVFGDGGLLGRPRALFYTWGRTEETGHAFISHVSDRAGVIVLRNAEDPLGAWAMESRDVFDDFARIFHRDPDEIRSVGFMSDTEQTGGRSLAYLRNLRWSPGARKAATCPNGL